MSTTSLPPAPSLSKYDLRNLSIPFLSIPSPPDVIACCNELKAVSIPAVTTWKSFNLFPTSLPLTPNVAVRVSRAAVISLVGWSKLKLVANASVF